LKEGRAANCLRLLRAMRHAVAMDCKKAEKALLLKLQNGPYFYMGLIRPPNGAP
jgi:hypothetical protein